MELVKGKFRIYNISKVKTINPFTCETLTDKDGLNIEMTTDDGESYFVISTVTTDKDGDIKISEVGTRVIDYVEVEDYWLYKQLVKIAIDIVRMANYEID